MQFSQINYKKLSHLNNKAVCLPTQCSFNDTYDCAKNNCCMTSLWSLMSKWNAFNDIQPGQSLLTGFQLVVRKMQFNKWVNDWTNDWWDESIILQKKMLYIKHYGFYLGHMDFQEKTWGLVLMWIVWIQSSFLFSIPKLTFENNFLKPKLTQNDRPFCPFLLGTLITMSTIYQRLLRNSCPLPMFMYVCFCPPISALRLPVLPFSITSVHSVVQVPWSLFCTLWSLHSQVLPQVLGLPQGSVEGTLFSLRQSFSAHCDLCAFF